MPETAPMGFWDPEASQNRTVKATNNAKANDAMVILSLVWVASEERGRLLNTRSKLSPIYIPYSLGSLGQYALVIFMVDLNTSRQSFVQLSGQLIRTFLGDHHNLRSLTPQSGVLLS